MQKECIILYILYVQPDSFIIVDLQYNVIHATFNFSIQLLLLRAAEQKKRHPACVRTYITSKRIEQESPSLPGSLVL